MHRRHYSRAAFCITPLPPRLRRRRAQIRLQRPLPKAPPLRRVSPTSNLQVVTALKTSSIAQALTFNSCLLVSANLLHQNVLTQTGLYHAFVLGVILWSCLSWPGFSLCFAFLILGSGVTRIGRQKKEALGIAEKRGGARGPENLWGAAAVSAICALGVAFVPFLSRGWGDAVREMLTSALLIGYTSSLATKFADTTSSEIGKAYGSATYLITSLQRVPRGTEGAVSVEGTLAGIIAASLASIYALFVGLIFSPIHVIICVAASFIATTAESFIGATIQERFGWSNEFVNFVNTLIGAIVAMGLYVVFSL